MEIPGGISSRASTCSSTHGTGVLPSHGHWRLTVLLGSGMRLFSTNHLPSLSKD